MKQITINLGAVDVSAAELVVLTGRSGQPGSMTSHPNTALGYQQIIKMVTARRAPARVILEATGVYGLGLALALEAAPGVEVMVVNPRVIKDYQRARLSRAKTDRVDARGLFDYLDRMPFVPWTPPAKEVLALQQLTRRMGQLKGELTRELARLHAVGYTPDKDDVIAHDLTLNIAHLKRRLKALHDTAIQSLKKGPALQSATELLITIPGIAHTSAMRILAEVLVLPSDLKAPQWVAQAGLDPRPFESGSSVHKPRRISKTGNRYLRTALFMPALVAVQRDQNIKAYYESLIARGKKPKQAIIAVMRKLLHCIWGMLRSRTPFQPNNFHPLPTTCIKN